MKKIALLLTTIFLLSINSVFAQCGNCRPSGFNLLYNYFAPASVQRIANPYFQARNIVNTARNPRSLLSPCNPVNRYIPGGYGVTTASSLINTNVNGNFVGGNQNSYNASYIPGNSYPQINQDAFVSNFNIDDQNNQSAGNSYFDQNTNSYVWILPDNNANDTNQEVVP